MTNTSFFLPVNIRIRMIKAAPYITSMAVVLMDLLVWRPN